jgi:hypothetical protein
MADAVLEGKAGMATTVPTEVVEGKAAAEVAAGAAAGTGPLVFTPDVE